MDDDNLPSTSLSNTWVSQNTNFTSNNDNNDETETLSGQQLSTSHLIADLKKRWDEAIVILFPKCQFNNHKDTTPSSKNHNTDENTNNHDNIQQSWFHKITSLQYSSTTRHYHTLRHLEEMFTLLDHLIPSETTPIERSIVTMAILFHDAIYDPQSPTNEDDSAALYRTFASELLIPSKKTTPHHHHHHHHHHVDAVVDYIRSTKGHKKPLPHHPAADDDDDDNRRLLLLHDIFLDVDLAVLAKRPAAYDRYARLIRREYEFVERDAYCERRADVLEGFLGREWLFFSEDARRDMEETARRNVKREVGSLRRGVIPGDDEEEREVVDGS